MQIVHILSSFSEFQTKSVSLTPNFSEKTNAFLSIIAQGVVALNIKLYNETIKHNKKQEKCKTKTYETFQLMRM